MKYLACKRVFYELNFHKKYISFCCSESRKSIPFFPMDDNKFRLDEFLDFRLKTIEQFKNGQIPCPPTCVHLEMREWPEDLKPMFAVVAINNFTACNCDCYYCSVKNTGISKYKPIDYLKALAKRHYFSNNCIFAWGGGEVSIYKDFEKELELSMYYNFKNVIHTSAIIFSPLIAKALKKSNTNLYISLDSGTAETYLKVKGVNKFNDVIDNIKIYSKCGSPLFLKYIFNEYNCTMNDLKGFVEICKIPPHVEPLASLTAHVISTKKYDENQFLHMYWLTKMLEAEKLTLKFFDPFFLPDAKEKFVEFCNSEKYEKLRNLVQI